jgi:prepilin-type N-terminal cleavage/methylation domain-containing protein
MKFAVSAFRLPPFAFRRFAAFTLLELLVALAVMSMMLAFMFNLMGASLSFWETGNRRMEAAQAARIGLNLIAKDLENAFAGNMTSYTTNGTAIHNIAPFMALGNNTTTTMGLGGSSVSAAGSQQIAGVTLTNDSSIPYNEFGFMAIFIDDPDGIDPMIGDRYYLVKKLESISGNGSGGNFYLRGNSTSSTWYQNALPASANANTFYPIADNCIRLTFEYYGDPDFGNPNDPAFSPVWSTTWNPANPTDRLPLGVLVTATVLDSRTVDKISALSSSPLTADDISAGINAASGNASASLDTIPRLIAQGAVTVRRFIPLNAN